MIASAHARAASRNETVTAGPAKLPAARAPTEKIPAPTATATPRIIRSQALSERRSLRPGSAASAMVRSMDLVRNRLRDGGALVSVWLMRKLVGGGFVGRPRGPWRKTIRQPKPARARGQSPAKAAA